MQPEPDQETGVQQAGRRKRSLQVPVLRSSLRFCRLTLRVEAPSLSQGVLAVRRDVDNRHRHTLSVLQTLEPRGTR